MNPAVEERIRTRAYELWEAEGRPGGREVEHWLQAAQEVAAEDGGGGGATPDSPAPAPVPRPRGASGGATARRTTKAAPPAAAPQASARPATGRTRATKKTGSAS
jgi:Protein of unknown function (DUF2934)